MVPNKKSKTPYTDIQTKIMQIITKKWQQLWEKNPHKLFQVQPILKVRNLDPHNTRKSLFGGQGSYPFAGDTVDKF